MSKATLTFKSSRPGVQPLLREVIETAFGGVHATFQGTEAELIAAGLATLEMFAAVVSAGQQSQSRIDDFGDDYTLKRMARGRWQLEIRTHAEGSPLPPSDVWPRGHKSWKVRGVTAAATTADILRRFARGQA